MAAQGVVVDGDAADPAVGGEHPGLRLDLLGGEDPGDRGQQRVAVEQLEVAGELLDAVDLAAALDLDGDRWRPFASRSSRSTGPIAVGYSRRTRV